MTNPRVVIERRLIDGKWTDILDKEATDELRNRGILTDSEIEEMLREADNIKEEYFCLRVKAIIAIAKKFGKRRAEMATLERLDLKVENANFL